MNISCTQKLLDALHMTAQSGSQDVSLFNWHATVTTFHRHKILLLFNDYSHYAVALYGVKADDLKDFNALVKKVVGEALAASGYSSDAIAMYLASSGDVCITKTNRKMISSINGAVRCFENELYYRDETGRGIEPVSGSLFRKDLSDIINELPVRINGDYQVPNDVMTKAIDTMLHGDADELHVKKPAYVMNIYLPIDENGVTRVLAVSADATFKQLHKNIQSIFCWQDYHMYCFDVLNEEMEVTASVLCENNECAWQGYSVKTKLRILLGDGCRFVYTYDYGDNWAHYIEAKYVDNYEEPLPCCIMGEGDAPPEDVGGEGGYSEFIAIINDEDNPERDEMLQWAQSNGWSRFDLSVINRKLK